MSYREEPEASPELVAAVTELIRENVQLLRLLVIGLVCGGGLFALIGVLGIASSSLRAVSAGFVRLGFGAFLAVCAAALRLWGRRFSPRHPVLRGLLERPSLVVEISPVGPKIGPGPVVANAILVVLASGEKLKLAASDPSATAKLFGEHCRNARVASEVRPG